MQTFDRLLQVIEATKEDVEKFEKGNKTAGTRLRKAMLEVKNIAHQIRKGVSEQKATQ
jgi:hypothetical protein